ncbi:hypothetical protein ACUXOC_000243 [Corynebacterium mucifaciens]
MSIDYDRLRELLERWRHGDEVRDQLEAQWEMELAAPDMARELLRLRNGIERVLAQMNDHATTLRRLERHNVAFHMEQYARLLADELNGDTE